MGSSYSLNRLEDNIWTQDAPPPIVPSWVRALLQLEGNRSALTANGASIIISDAEPHLSPFAIDTWASQRRYDHVQNLFAEWRCCHPILLEQEWRRIIPRDLSYYLFIGLPTWAGKFNLAREWGVLSKKAEIHEMIGRGGSGTVFRVILS